MQVPEGTAEGDLLAWTQSLASEDEELMLIERVHHGAMGRFVMRAGKIEPDRLGEPPAQLYAASGPIVISVFTNANRGDFLALEATLGQVAEDVLDAWGSEAK